MDIVLRATVIFLALYLVVRLLGKRELGQMTPFELIVLVVIGDLIQQGVTQNDFSLTGAIIAVSTIAFWALVLQLAQPICRVGPSGCSRASRASSSATASCSRRNLRRRPADAAGDRVGDAPGGHRRDWRDVAWGILEPRGKISFIQRADDGGEEPPPQPKGEEDDGAA